MVDLLSMLAPVLAVLGLAYGAWLCLPMRTVTADTDVSLEASAGHDPFSLPKTDWDLLHRGRSCCGFTSSSQNGD